MSGLLVFLAQVLSASLPLCLAAAGGALSERSGVATISLEAYLLGGAFGAAVTALATGSSVAAALAGMAAGAMLGALFAWSAVTLRAHAIVAGVAVNLFAAAATRVALKVLYDSASNSPPLPLGRAHAGASLGVAALREVLLSPPLWAAPVLVAGAWWLLARSVFGLRVTACGEHPAAARSVGVPVERVRFQALVLGGMVAGLGGAHLTLQQREFVAYMSGGRGFLALAAVILGRWEPVRAAAWAVAIGALAALEATLAGNDAMVPRAVQALVSPAAFRALVQALPFALTLAAVAGRFGRSRAPAALG
ncbi:MAG: ABC transporter permease [Polyangiales bacterium]